MADPRYSRAIVSVLLAAAALTLPVGSTAASSSVHVSLQDVRTRDGNLQTLSLSAAIPVGNDDGRLNLITDVHLLGRLELDHDVHADLSGALPAIALLGLLTRDGEERALNGITIPALTLAMLPNVGLEVEALRLGDRVRIGPYVQSGLHWYYRGTALAPGAGVVAHLDRTRVRVGWAWLVHRDHDDEADSLGGGLRLSVAVRMPERATKRDDADAG